MQFEQFVTKWCGKKCRKATLSGRIMRLDRALRALYRTLDKCGKTNQTAQSAVLLRENWHLIWRELDTLRAFSKKQRFFCIRHNGLLSFRLLDCAEMVLSLHENGWTNKRIEQHLSDLISEECLVQEELWQIETALRIVLLTRIERIFRSGKQESVLLRDSVHALYALADIDWHCVLLSMSPIHKIYESDEIYSKCDLSSKQQLCSCTAVFAARSGVSECAAAQLVRNLAVQTRTDISYYLLGLGKKNLYRELGCKTPAIACRASTMFMIGVLFVSLLLSLIAWFAFGWISVIMRILILGLSVRLMTRIFALFYPPKRLVRLDFRSGIDDAHRTLAAIAFLAASVSDVKKALVQLEDLYLTNRGNGLGFALLSDFADSTVEICDGDLVILKELERGIQSLNKKYETDVFCLFHRKRTLSPDGIHQGWERKRGAVMTLARAMTDAGEPFLLKIVPNDFYEKPFVYLAVLDADTKPYPGTLCELAGILAHPLQSKYAVISMRNATSLSSIRTKLQRKLCQDPGMFCYRGPAASLYQDIAGEGIFCGKGILDVKKFLHALDGKIPENRILSHDLLEGLYAKCAYSGDVLFFDSLPSTIRAFFKRQERWIRGDFQLLPWLFARKNGLSLLDRWKIADNIRRWLTPPIVFLSVTVSCALARVDISLLCLLLYAVMQPRQMRMIGILLLPYEAWVNTLAASRALWRMLVSKRSLLEWTTAAHSERGEQIDWLCLYVNATGALLLSAVSLIHLKVMLFALPLCMVWLYGIIYAMRLGDDIPKPAALSEKQRSMLVRTARRTYLWFESVLDEKHHYLVPDNQQINPQKEPAARTSPSNIGFSLCAHCAAYVLGYIDKSMLFRRISNTFETIEKLEKWHGHLYNWYDTKTLEPLEPRYVSSVDSGNLCACIFMCIQVLISDSETVFDQHAALDQLLEIAMEDGSLTLQQVQKIRRGSACIVPRELTNALSALQTPEEIPTQAYAELVEKMSDYVRACDFGKLYNPTRKLFYVGFDACAQTFGNAHYDLLASEARLTSLLAVAKGDVPQEHFDRLSRRIVRDHGLPVLLSWSGTLFEYLMPMLFIGQPEGSLCQIGARSAVLLQKYFGTDGIWGKTESGYYRFDAQCNYQYYAFGIESLSVRSELLAGAVYAPYGVLMALMLYPQEAIVQLEHMYAKGLRGRFGFYEAIDFGYQGKNIVASYMSHHQAMGLMAIEQVLGGKLQKLFMEIPIIRSWSLLLEETMPKRMPTQSKIKHYNTVGSVRKSREKRMIVLNKTHHEMAMIGNEQANMIFGGGKNAVSFRDVRMNRFKSGANGIHVRISTGKHSVSTQQCICFWYDGQSVNCPIETEALRGTVRFQIDPYRSGISVRVALVKKKQSSDPVRVDLYWEPMLADIRQDGVHPAFSDLFLKLEPYRNGIIVSRIPRGETGAVYAYATCTGSQQITHILDRRAYWGRNGNNPADGKEDIAQSVQPCAALCTWSGNDEKQLKLKFEIGLCDSYQQAKTRVNTAPSESIVYAVSTQEKSEMQAAARLLALLSDDCSKPFPCAQYTQLRTMLWQIGISGDDPYIVVTAQPQAAFLSELCRIVHGIFSNSIPFDILFVLEEASQYFQPIKNDIIRQFRQSDFQLRKESLEKIHFISSQLLNAVSLQTVKACANAVLDAGKSLFEQLEVLTRKSTVHEEARKESYAALPLREERSKALPMGFGGFDSQQDYVLELGNKQHTPMPYSYVMANAQFGTLVTETLGGYTWAQNSARNKLTPWYNEPVLDPAGEQMRIRIQKDTWQQLYLGGVTVKYSKGTAAYSSEIRGICLHTQLFVPPDESRKYVLVTLKNENPQSISLSFQTKIRFQLAERLDPALRSIRMYSNAYGVSASNIRDVQGSVRLCTLGKAPDDVYPPRNMPASVYANAVGALSWQLTIAPGQEEKLGWVLELADTEAIPEQIDWNHALRTLEKTKSYWGSFLSKVRIETPDPSVNALVNVWLPYQTYACRMLARSAYYQAGGAYGFRDQLQDACALMLYDPSIARKQILSSCAHQFPQGDVLHWWHEPALGVRTKISDDLLFLPWLVTKYVNASGDLSVLSEKVSFLEPVDISEGKEDLFQDFKSGEETADVLEHCKRAINRASSFGRHGLVRMGTGDWNDAMNAVGKEGKGESVFCSWFLYRILLDFADLLDRLSESEQAAAYRSQARILLDAIEQHAWDGRWYRRAYFDDGTPLGAQSAQACQIDLVAQSWAVLSKGANPQRAKSAMQYAYRFLYDPKHQLVRLLTPPFDTESPVAGYINAYPPGVRENGGQYTHAAIWFLIAFCEQGDFARAQEILHALLPTTHSNTREKAERYAVEPYVMAADVYGGLYPGRGGWTWYTGSAGWMLQAILHALLGIKMENGKTSLDPPEGLWWDHFSVVLHGRRYDCQKQEGKWVVEQTDKT